MLHIDRRFCLSWVFRATPNCVLCFGAHYGAPPEVVFQNAHKCVPLCLAHASLAQGAREARDDASGSTDTPRAGRPEEEQGLGKGQQKLAGSDEEELSWRHHYIKNLKH